jgi:hypothetical protein
MNTGVATPRPARTWVIFSFLSASVLCAALVAQPSFAESLTTSAQQQVLASTFEVVQLKPDEGAVTYERALPMELIPYQQRIDKYRSIGTAFAIGGNRYVTAAHVFLLGFGSQFGPPALRDTTGEVYAIAKVLKYSQEQDFVEFSLQHEPKSPQSLTIGTAVLNDPVFAVGNALGQGIVIRDGVFTSETPEEREGRWQWLRFSAAASPGNSGGPLVDKDGKVLGVVLRKSQNENLNMAAPIKLVTDAPESEALIEDRNTVRFAIMDASELVDVHERIPLPATPEKVFAALLKIEAAVSEREDHQYREHYKDRLFPNGSSSQALLHEVLRAPFPHRIQERQGDRVWVAAAPKEPQVAQLDHNGYVRYGGGGIRLRAPDDVKLATLYGDSKLFMDMLLRTSIPLKRPVGSDSVKVTSLGKAREEFSYTDAYGRVWQFRVWAIPFDDSYVIVDSLPTPEGSVSHLTAGVSGLKDNLIRSQEFLTNFTWVTYEGTLSRWREYLALKGVQPQVFSKLTLTVDPDYKRVQFHSKRYDLSLGSDVVALTSDAVLSMNFSFFTDGTGVVWDVGGMAIGEGTGRPNFFDISRFVRPDAALPEGFQNNWSKIVAGDFPFNAKATDVNGGMRITMVAESPAVAAKSAPSGATGVVKVSEKGTAEKSAAVTPGAAPAAGAAQGGDVRYVLSVGNEGQPGQDAMQAKLDALNKAFKPLEQ